MAVRAKVEEEANSQTQVQETGEAEVQPQRLQEQK